MIFMFAIPNCDTVKKARHFLEMRHIAYQFVDFKKTPPTQAQIKLWIDCTGELPINKKGTTYRKHKDQYEGFDVEQKIDFIIVNPSIIKRPILERDGKVLAIGFDEAVYNTL